MRNKILSVLFVLIFVSVLTVQAQEQVQIPALPTDPAALPNDLIEGIRYQQPLDQCWLAPDPDRTCSLQQQQEEAGVFRQPSRGIRYMTGDAIYLMRKGAEGELATILTDEGFKKVPASDLATSLSPEKFSELVGQLGPGNWIPIVPRLADVTFVETDTYVLYNGAQSPVEELGQLVPFGGFWGNAGVPVTISDTDAMANGRDLHINKMLNFSESTTNAIAAANGADIYPLVNRANCADVNEIPVDLVTYCAGTNVYVLMWNGEGWQVLNYGFAYIDPVSKQLVWVDYMTLLNTEAPASN